MHRSALPAVLAFALTTVSTLVPTLARADTLNPTRISLPSGPASIEGLGRNFAPSLASGTASYGIDIALPPSAGGFAPHLSLDYDSGGGASEIGIGWRLPLPRVRRRTENGLPRFDATDAFEITGLGIPSDLLEVTAGVYRPQYESGAFVRVQRAGDGWEARDRSGTTYRFGGDGFVEAEGAHVATWLLREMADVHGHRIAFAWDTSTGWARLVSVVWNDYGADVRNEVTFSYEDRPDPHTLFSNGIRQALTKRLAAIEVKHGGALVRRYDLTHTAGIHSQLAAVDVTGRDGVSHLPRLSLGYTEASLATDAAQVVTMATPPGRSPADADVELADLDGDSLPDLLVTKPGAYRSYVNHDGRSWEPGVDWDAAQSPSLALGTTGVQLADLDGDGAMDLVAKSGTNDFRYFPGSTATSFRPSVAIATVPSFSFEDPDVRLADMDGDRRVDAVVTSSAGLAIGYNLSGADWSAPTIVGVVDPRQALRFSDGGHTQLCDVNGDHVQDLCYLTPGSLAYWLGRGRGVFEAPRVATGVPSWDPSRPWELHDLDGDGWVDLVHVGVDEVDYALAVGEGRFDAPKALSGTPSKGPTTAVRFADMNGSGTTDIVWIDVSGSPDQAWRYLELFPAGRGGLLEHIDNGLGKITRITYAPAALDAAAARAAGKPWASRMNVGMPVVKRVEMDDSLGDPVVASESTYRDGTWSPAERTFAGFAGGTDRALGDAYTPTLVTESAFDVGLDDRTQRGLVVSVERRDEAGRVFDRVASAYASRTLDTALDGRAVHYTFKVSETTTSIEGGNAPRTTLTEWEQDDLGDVTAERRWGEVVGSDKLAGGDEAITVRTFASNMQDWILGHVATEELQDGRGARVRMARTYYDGLPLGQLARGDVTRAEAWRGPALDAFELVTATRYDADGNVLETTDARGGGHLFTWDGHDHTTLLSETVKLDGGKSFIETADTDRALGQLTRVTGYDGQTTTVSYDAFGRVTSLVRPGDTADRPTLTYAYDQRAPLPRLTTERRMWSGRDDVEHEETVFDGTGRKRAVLTRDDGNRWVLSGVSLLDARGQPRRTLRARFADAGAIAAPPLFADGPGVDTWRDALARTVRTRSQLGFETRTTFAPFVTQAWDGAQSDASSPYEHTPVVTTVDGLGRTVSRSETLSGKLIAATFSYDAAGDLLSKTDPEGNVSRYAYDGRGRRTLVDDPDTGKHAFVYDATGNLTEHQEPDGAVVRFSFDLAGRALTEDWNGDGTPDVTRTWDVGGPSFAGRLASVADPSGSTSFEYDARGRTTKVHYAIGGSTYDVASAFDAQDREYWYQFPDGSSFNTHRNARGLVSGYASAVTFAYDADGAETSRTFNTGVIETSTYDDDRRRTESRVTAPNGGALQALRWRLDGASNILAVEDLRGADPARDRSETYGYDNLYRLVSASGTWGSTKWGYSPSGSLTTRSSTEPSQDAGSVTYGGAGPHAMTGFKGRTLHYDARGRMRDDGDRAYEWDGADHLTRVTRANGASVESTFDGSGGRRLRVERLASGETHTTAFIDSRCEVKDGQLVRYIVHGGTRIARLSPTNGTPAQNASSGAPSRAADDAEPPSARTRRLASLTRQLPSFFLTFAVLVVLVVTYRARIRRALRVAGPVVAIVAASAACSHDDGGQAPSLLEGSIHELSDADDLLFADAIGTLTEQTSGTGSPKASFATYPFGLTRFDTSGETNKYAGTPRDNGVELDMMGARAYAADLGAWTSADPFRVSSPARGSSSRFSADHSYAYAWLSPLLVLDRGGSDGWFSDAVKSATGFVTGVLQGATPGGMITAAAPLPEGADENFKYWQAGGQIVGGIIGVVDGVPEVGGGIAASATGGGAVVGVPAIVVGAASVANGVVAVGVGISTLMAKGPPSGAGPSDSPPTGAPEEAPSKPTRPYNRKNEYGRTPTKADRKALGAGPDEVVDHDPPLVKRYYEGDPSIGEKPGYQMTPEERAASAGDRSRMQLQPRSESNAQGGQMRAYSQEQKEKNGL